MRLKLVVPGWPVTSIWHDFLSPLPYLNMPTLAAITPEAWEVTIEDENVAPLGFDDAPDLVGITALTAQAPRAYQIATEFRARGVKVVMGGFHASALPEEAKRHVDAVVVGEAERVWARLLDDAVQNRLAPFYRDQTHADLAGLPPARWDLLQRKRYILTNLMQTTRGCPFDCEFCSVTAFHGRTFRGRPLLDVERELKTVSGSGNFLFFVDDNIVGNTVYAKQLFTLLKQYRFHWMSQASLTLAEPRLLQLARESGCCGVFIGFESLMQQTLDQANKRFVRVDRYVDAIKRIHDHGIGIQGSFVFGYDGDTARSFDEVVEFVDRTRIETAFFTILTPLPGTRVYQRLKAEDRIVSTDWERYDMSHAVFRPMNMSPEELEGHFMRANREVHRIGSLLKRLPVLSRRVQVFGPMNWAFRRAWRRVEALRGSQAR